MSQNQTCPLFSPFVESLKQLCQFVMRSSQPMNFRSQALVLITLGFLLVLAAPTLASNIGQFDITLQVTLISVDLEDLHGRPYPGWLLGLVETHSINEMADEEGLYIHNQSNIPINLSAQIRDIGPILPRLDYNVWIPVDTMLTSSQAVIAGDTISCLNGFMMHQMFTDTSVYPADWTSFNRLVNQVRYLGQTWPPEHSGFAYLHFHSLYHPMDAYIHRLQITWIFSAE